MGFNTIFQNIAPDMLLDGLPVACICFDIYGNPIACNSMLVNLLKVEDKDEAMMRFRDQYIQTAHTTYTPSFQFTCINGHNESIALNLVNTRIDYNGIDFVMSVATEISNADERVQLMLDASPVSITFYNKDLQPIDCNQATVRMFGFSNKEEYLKNLTRLAPPFQPNGRSSRKLFIEYMLEAFHYGNSEHEFICQLRDGTLIPTEIDFVRMEYKGDHVVLAYTRDMTKEKEAAAEVRAAHETTEIFMATAPVGIELWDDQVNIVDCNHYIAQMFGLSNKDEYLRKVKNFWSGASGGMKYYLQALRDGEVHYEWTYSRPDGVSIPCEITLVRVMRNKTPHIVSYIHDLTKIKEAIDKASEAEQRAILMLDANPLACYLVSLDFKAIDCNQAAINLFGFADKNEALSKHKEIFPLTAPDGTPRMSLDSLHWMLDKPIHHFEYTHQSITGNLIPTMVTLVTLKYQGETIVASYMQDLRQLKEMIEGMKRLELVEEESRAKSQFLARMSHEIRTPMNSIVGFTDIQLNKGNLKPEIEETFLQIKSSSKTLLTIINDILDLSKIEAGKMDIVPAPYELASLINDTTQLNIMIIGSKNIQFKLEVDANLPMQLMGDEVRLKQILNNLLSNAIKYTHEGKVTFSVYLETIGASNFLAIDIHDTGQGMTEEQISALFSSEYIRFGEENRTIEGTGLGLNITYKLIQQMKGTMSVVSTPGRGSTFSVRIPQNIVDSNAIGEEQARSLEQLQFTQKAMSKRQLFEYEQMPYGKVLVVDDVDTNLQVAKGLLALSGIRAETANSGREAINLIRKGNIYDIIFMDHMMPEMDGIEAARTIKELDYDHPIVALTANTIIGQSELFLSNGFAGFVSKPIDISNLNMYLTRYISSKYTDEEKATMSSGIEVSDTPIKEYSAMLAEAFVRDATNSLAVLDSLFAKDLMDSPDIKLYTTTVHGMKSALANIGELTLSTVAETLETAGRIEDKSIIYTKTPDFLIRLRNIVENLTVADTDDDIVDEDPVLLRDRLTIIQDACDIMNKRAAKVAIDELNNHSWSKETKAFISQISTHLLRSEFDEAIEAISMFLS